MTTANVSPAPTARRDVERLLGTEVDFIDNPEFRRRNAAKRILACGPDGSLPDDPSPRLPRAPRDLPAYLASLYEVPLLSKEGEPRAFRRLNFAKYRANVLRSRLDPNNVDEASVEEIRELMRTALETRDAIVRANLRLVVSIARRFASPARTFDELVCEGNLILLQAVEKFDYGRGFRFSTYATHAVQRSLYRSLGRTQRDATRFTTGLESVIDETPVDGDPEPNADETDDDSLARLLLEHVDSELGERERSILLARYGLDEEHPQTLKQLSERFGVCKERVRQIQLKALDKLREFAAEVVPDAEFATAVA